MPCECAASSASASFHAGLYDALYNLDPETLERPRVADGIGGQELDGDPAPKAFVLGQVNHSHAARSKLAENAVVRDRAPDHQSGL